MRKRKCTDQGTDCVIDWNAQSWYGLCCVPKNPPPKKLQIHQSSKGNQLKWENKGVWYKADYTGYEGLSEYLISNLLCRSTLHEAEFVRYEPEQIRYRQKIYEGVKSENFSFLRIWPSGAFKPKIRTCTEKNTGRRSIIKWLFEEQTKTTSQDCWNC